MMGALQEAEQRAMRARLRHAVQVEPGVDLLPPARQMRALAAAERRQRRRRLAFEATRLRGGDGVLRRRGRFRRGSVPTAAADAAVALRRAASLRSGLTCSRDALPQRALLFAQAALAPRRLRQFGNRTRRPAFHLT